MIIDATNISKVLSDPIRYKILLMLMNHQGMESLCLSFGSEGVCNCDIMQEFGLIQSRVSYHMKELTSSGLVREEPKGKWKYYVLNKETVRNYIKQLGSDFKL
ncbi:MAG: metalloregulator ArsR/SmtB family transcription factor [Desulfitobacterium hafniense]|nr:metalloregulator ArsR/SmtB family transcription factor [Desulfitobacterium hafniense]